MRRPGGGPAAFSSSPIERRYGLLLGLAAQPPGRRLPSRDFECSTLAFKDRPLKGHKLVSQSVAFRRRLALRWNRLVSVSLSNGRERNAGGKDSGGIRCAR